ncbi:MAG: hypothetical protein AB4426_16670, partial [Xenococcaceae cyanobacterium]
SVGKDKSQVISLTQPRALTFSEKQEIAELLRTGEKIAAIKQYKEAFRLFENYRFTFGNKVINP